MWEQSGPRLAVLHVFPASWLVFADTQVGPVALAACLPGSSIENCCLLPQDTKPSRVLSIRPGLLKLPLQAHQAKPAMLAGGGGGGGWMT